MKENRAFVPSLSSPALGGLQEPARSFALCLSTSYLQARGEEKPTGGVGFCSDIINNNHHHHLSFPSRMFEKQIADFFGEEIQGR